MANPPFFAKRLERLGLKLCCLVGPGKEAQESSLVVGCGARVSYLLVRRKPHAPFSAQRRKGLRLQLCCLVGPCVGGGARREVFAAVGMEEVAAPRPHGRRDSDLRVGQCGESAVEAVEGSVVGGGGPAVRARYLIGYVGECAWRESVLSGRGALGGRGCLAVEGAWRERELSGRGCLAEEGAGRERVPGERGCLAEEGA